MVIVVFFEDDLEKRNHLLNTLMKEFPMITSLYYVINSKKNDSFYDQKLMLFSGAGYITEIFRHPDESVRFVRYRIGPKSFFQTNPKQAENMYSVVYRFCNLNGNEVVYDLYSGTGSIACYVARKAKTVIGIESVDEAVRDARENAVLNGITNIHFFAGNAEKMLDHSFAADKGKPDVVITDPPRAGMHADVVSCLGKVKPKRIVYVSCNPATQARDIAMLSGSYEIKEVQPVDMFPHTHHVENVVLLERKV
jgi:23S rRNA (uracil1939-C5)-methyltransferase